MSSPAVEEHEPPGVSSACPPLSRETRWLRLGGIALILLAGIVFTVFQAAFEPAHLVQLRGRANIIRVIVAVMVLANGFAFGLVLLLAGLRHASPLTSRRARGAALTRMGALNMLLVCFIVAAMADTDALGEASYEQWYVVPALIGFVVLARSGIRLFRSAWKYEARPAAEALAADPRPPVLYLRSFAIDDEILVTAPGVAARFGAFLSYTASVSPEQEMAFIMERVGPVVAIGKPGEPLPELGAARLYVGDEQWRSVVGGLMTSAALVVIRAGETANLWWEIEEAIARCARQRVVIMALAAPEALAAFDERFAQAFGAPASRPLPRPSPVLMPLLRLLFPSGRTLGKIIYFDQRGAPCQEPLAYHLTWPGVVLSPYRPYRDSLQAAFRTVFARLGLDWAVRPTQTVAVLLALFGGMFGLHHFYMGHKRRGIWTLALFWIVLPIVIGWIDAVRLALLDEAQFQSRLNLISTAPSPGAPR